MDCKKIGADILVRLDPGEDIVETMVALARKEGITAASISGIGATDDFTVGIFDMEKGQYNEVRFANKGNYEITGLIGNFTTMDAKEYLHLHMMCAGPGGEIVGGHLLKANISLTAEIFVHVMDGTVDRKHNDTLNINQLAF